jgi:hypothetical protein
MRVDDIFKYKDIIKEKNLVLYLKDNIHITYNDLNKILNDFNISLDFFQNQI